jgi:hypothetical protein
MEATLEWQRRLRELIPNAAERGALKPILQRMRPEEVLSIFDDDDDAVLASLQQIHREATVSRIESLMSTLQSLVRGLASCFSGGPTPEPFPLQLLPPPAGVCSISPNLITFGRFCFMLDIFILHLSSFFQFICS